MKKVTKLEEYKNRIKVYIDEKLIFLLYKGEVRKFQLKEKELISDNTYNEILDLLYKRARERALYILDNSYKTENQIREKLKNGLYPEVIIDKVVDYLIEYNLIDDKRFASMYIEYKSASKSKKQIIQDLFTKGVSGDIIGTAFEESDYSDEESLNKIIDKKITKYNLNDNKDLQKLYRYLIGKGYNYNDVKKALSNYIY